jgi:hypothetical protein
MSIVNESYLEFLKNSLLTEKKVEVKRKYRENPSKIAYENASVRNTILKFVSEKGIVESTELKKYIETLEESEDSKAPSRSWFAKNKNLFKIVERNGRVFYTLSSYGERMYEKIFNSTKQVSEEFSSPRSVDNCYVVVSDGSEEVDGLVNNWCIETNISDRKLLLSGAAFRKWLYKKLGYKVVDVEGEHLSGEELFDKLSTISAFTLHCGDEMYVIEIS